MIKVITYICLLAFMTSPCSANESLPDTLTDKIFNAAELFVPPIYFRSFYAPSTSMSPTLLMHDSMYVRRYTHGAGFWGRKSKADVKQGDVILFWLPSNKNIIYVKRLIGMPGDKIQMKDGVLYINDNATEQKRTDDFVGLGAICNQNKSEIPIRRYIEKLPNGVSYEILDCGSTVADNTQLFVVPADHYFVMGDNRDNSMDSRFSDWGFIPVNTLIGRAEIRFISVDINAPLSKMFRWSRLFTTIH